MTATMETSPKPVNFLVNFWGILTAPRLALARVSSVQPRSWWFPALLAWAMPVLQVILTLDLQIEQQKKVIALSLSAMPADQVEAARPLLERMTQPRVLVLNAAVSVALGLLVAWGISMLILYFSMALAGNPPKANALWAAVTWAWIPFALRPLVQAAWSLYSGALIQYPGLSYLFATGKLIEDQKNPLFAAAAQIDLFALWHLVLIYFLFRVLGRLRPRSSFLATGFYALLQLGIHVLPVFATRLMGT